MLGTIWGVLLAIVFGTYLVPHFVVAFFFKTKNLKKAYNATWALVTGGSSGIGKAIAKKLATQGINVVIVALDDQVLTDAVEELSTTYPEVTFKKVGADLSSAGFLSTVQTATADIDIQLFFLNAGYMVTGFFSNVSLDRINANIHTNANSAVVLTHYFLQKMLAKKLKGCFVYTSSAAACLPSPFSVTYAATKAFISAFGASLASEVKHSGIDVLVFHPSPVATRFYDNQLNINILEFFKGFAVSADELPDVVFASIGRTVWRDIGPTAVGFRLLTKLVDYNFIAVASALFAHTMPDFKRHQQPKKQS